ncbi:Cys-tRNA(Pro) deacylase [bacterium]|nr:Cys-tRNA(Pro) deacylase [bacterium]
MTPAVTAAQKAKIPFTLHEYEHNPAASSFGEEAARALGVSEDRVFKTLIVALDGQKSRLAVAIVPVSKQLDLKVFAAVIGARKAEMADTREAERATGYVVGGISPLGQRKRLPTVVDVSADMFDTVYVSAGKRGLQIELAPGSLATMTGAKTAAIAR